MAKGKGAKKAGAKAKAGGPRAPAARLTPQQLYEQAQMALQYDDFDGARTALRKAVKLEPRNPEYVDALGALLAEIGPQEEAIEVLRRGIELQPNAGHEKYLYLGQLIVERGADSQAAAAEAAAQALAATRKGVELLQAEHAASTAADPASPATKHLASALSAALCSLAEMLLVGAEEVGQVAAEAEHLLALAATANPSSPEPAQALASLRYEQGRAEEALEALRRSMALWYSPTKEGDEEEAEAGGAGAGGGDAAMEDAEGGDDEEDSDSDEEEDEDDPGPSYEFRVECAKLLLELEDTTATAVDVLETLIEEDDRVPDAWQLLTLALYSGHQYGEAAEALAKGKALLAALGAGPEDDVVQVFAELESAINEALALEKQQQGQPGQG